MARIYSNENFPLPVVGKGVSPGYCRITDCLCACCKLRVPYTGAIYHVMNRGDHREPMVKDDSDHQPLLETLVDCTRGTVVAM